MTPRLIQYLLLLTLLGSLNKSHATNDLTISWTNNMLSIASPEIPGGPIKIWYLEAFCKTGSTDREWNKTTIPHKTELIKASRNGKRIRLQTIVEPNVIIDHDIRAGKDEVDFKLNLVNKSNADVDVDWFQPCIRVGGFTGRKQEDYVDRCFIYTGRGLTTLDKTKRTEEARYRGGQVYVPPAINLKDVNPRPISPDKPVNGLMGCFSADNKYLMATAWDQTQELFQGVIICIHNDPRVGGLKAGEKKKLRGKVYIMKNDPNALLERYEKDFK